PEKTKMIDHMKHICILRKQKCTGEKMAKSDKNFNKSDLERLKKEVRIIDLAMARGIKFKSVGSNEYVCLCPFHAEKTGSCHINVVKNEFHCHGCQKGGDVIK